LFFFRAHLRDRAVGVADHRVQIRCLLVLSSPPVSLLSHPSGRYPKLDLRRAETQVALTLEPGFLGPAVASQ
jgi:hypothetical protein